MRQEQMLAIAIHGSYFKSSVDRLQGKEKNYVYLYSYAINPLNGACPIYLIILG